MSGRGGSFRARWTQLICGRALRYVELNPVRAGMVSEARLWRWSSAGAHCGLGATNGFLVEMEDWRKRWTVAEWRHYMGAGEAQSDLCALRQCTHTGRPLGSAEFVTGLEATMMRPLVPRKGGRPKKPVADSRQNGLEFVA